MTLKANGAPLVGQFDHHDPCSSPRKQIDGRHACFPLRQLRCLRGGHSKPGQARFDLEEGRRFCQRVEQKAWLSLPGRRAHDARLRATFVTLRRGILRVRETRLVYRAEACRRRRMVDQNSASWNRVVLWMRQLESLSRVL